MAATAKASIFILLIGLFGLITSWSSGCRRQDANIAGVTIPIPGEMKKLPDKVFDPIPGFEDGQVSYRGQVAPGEIFSFYQENMEARGWTPTTFMAGEKDQYAYAKGDRICLVWSSRNYDGTTDLTIMVGSSRPDVFGNLLGKRFSQGPTLILSPYATGSETTPAFITV